MSIRFKEAYRMPSFVLEDILNQPSIFKEAYRMHSFVLEDILNQPSIFKDLKPSWDFCGSVISVPIEYPGEWVEDLNVVNKKENV